MPGKQAAEKGAGCDAASTPSNYLTIRRTKPVSNEEEMQVEGDRDLASSHPVLQKMNPCVGEMVWLFSGEQ
jgi:hypothetical protein